MVIITPLLVYNIPYMRKERKIAVLLPCYNEEEALPLTISSLRKTISKNITIICVDDGSVDGTWKVISRLSRRGVVGIKLSHNVGQQRALMAGLMYTKKRKFDAVISMDADLQDDICVINEMIKKYFSGAEIVYGVRQSRRSDGFLKKVTSSIFYKFMKLMGVEMISDAPDFRLLSSKALSALSEYREYNLVLKGIVPKLGFKSDKVFFERKKRVAGKTKYNLFGLINVALDSVTSFSIRPLRLLLLMGVMFFILGIGMIGYVLIEYFLQQTISGWPFIVCSIWIIGGCVMISIGILGEYIGKIYLESKQRPRYFIEKVIGEK